MRLKRYAVTVLDNWTATRTFWTYGGARRFFERFRGGANLFIWQAGQWRWALGVVPWDKP